MTKALIIGGGIGGLSTATSLKRVGIDVAVFERAPELLHVGAGITLWSNAIHSLDTLGIANDVVQSGVTITASQIRDSQGKVLANINVKSLCEKLGASSIGVHRADLQRILYNSAGEDSVQLGKECIGIFQDDDGVTASFSDGSRATGDLLIGADGLHSVVRADLFSSSQPNYAGYTVWRGVAYFDDSRFQAGIASESWGRGARFGWLYIDSDRAYWYAAVNAREGNKVPENGDKAELLERFKRWHEPIEALIRSTDDSAILHNDVYDIEPLASWGLGRVALMGDAAHAITPNLGQGACQAIEDAVALGNSLKEYGGITEAIQDYERKRIRRASSIVKQSRLIGQVAQFENPVACWFRNSAIAMTPSWAGSRRLKSLLTPVF